MNFTAITTALLDKHKRPDKLVDSQRAINAAVLFYSTEYDYERDLVESVVPISPAAYTHEIDVMDLIRFRKIDYIRIAGSKTYIEKLESRKLTSECDIRNKWYIAGSSLKINMAQEASGLDLCYYQYPPILTDLAPEFWMLQGNWRAIMEHAAATIFNDIGDVPASSKAMQDSVLAATIFRGDYVRSNQHT